MYAIASGSEIFHRQVGWKKTFLGVEYLQELVKSTETGLYPDGGPELGEEGEPKFA